MQKVVAAVIMKPTTTLCWAVCTITIVYIYHSVPLRHMHVLCTSALATMDDTSYRPRESSLQRPSPLTVAVIYQDTEGPNGDALVASRAEGRATAGNRPLGPATTKVFTAMKSHARVSKKASRYISREVFAEEAGDLDKKTAAADVNSADGMLLK